MTVGVAVRRLAPLTPDGLRTDQLSLRSAKKKLKQMIGGFDRSRPCSVLQGLTEIFIAYSR